jgi:hypothetical protein
MLNKQSIEIYTLTGDREKRLWKDCIFVFDTSALLRLYYYLPQILEKIDNIFLELKRQERLWIPQRVEYEYLKNRETKILEPIQEYKDLINNDKKNDSHHLQNIDQSRKKIEQIFDEEIKKIRGQFNTLSQKTQKKDEHPYFEDTSLIEKFQNVIANFQESVGNELEKFKILFDEFKDNIEKEISSREEERKKIISEKHLDTVLKIFSYFQLGEEYSFDKLIEIAKEGDERYSLEIPPGYKDKTEKAGIRKYGDLIIWKQIIDYAKQNKKNIILINNDNKDDWWDKTPKKPKPREELIKEFFDYTDQMEIWMYNLSDFIHKAKQLLGAKVDQAVLEKVKEIEEEQLKQKEEEIAEILIATPQDVTRMPSYHHPQEQDYWQEEIEIETSIGQPQTIRTNLLRVYPESFNSYDAYMDIPMSINPDIQKVISPRLGKTWEVITGPTESRIRGYFRGDYTDNNPPAWVFGLRLSQEEDS